MVYQVEPDTFGFVVSDISRLIRAAIDRRIAAAGLDVTATEARTLMHIQRAGQLRQNVLAERIGVEAMTVSNTLDRLEARGLILRKPDPADRRAKLVSCTEAATDVLQQASRISTEVRTQAAGDLPSDEWAAILETLKEVRANLTAGRAQDEERHKGKAP